MRNITYKSMAQQWGTRVAPTYANLFMSQLEEKYVYGKHSVKTPKVWFRFIDDIWSIFNGTESELTQFVAYLNMVHPSIKFTETHSRDQIQFLDVTTVNVDQHVETDLFIKPTDSQSYLHYSSCHPMSIKNSIPYSQFLRIRRNCTDWVNYFRHSLCLSHHLLLRGYPIDLIKNSIQKMGNKTQSNLLRNTTTTTEKKFYCITDYNPTNPNIVEIIKDVMRYADRSSSTRPLSNIPIVYGHRKPKNIGDTVVRSKLLSENDPRKRKSPKCHKFVRCRHCPLIMNKHDKGQIKSTSTSRKYRIPIKVTCNSKNIIYCIQCAECGIQYVGQTKNKFLARINQHRSDIKLKKDTPISRHFNQHKKYTLYVLQLINVNNLALRTKFEN